MGCRTKKLVGSLFKITVGAFGGKPFSKMANMIIKITVGAFGGKPFSKVANMVMGFFDASMSGQASNLSPSSLC